VGRFQGTLAARRARACRIFDRLRKAYPDARCSLQHKDPLQLLVATILAAQCTDERVNMVTRALFKKYRRPEDYVAAPRVELEDAIRACGFFRQKARFITNVCKRILDVYDGKVPHTMADLLTLDGVGRKTANVILGECFHTPGIIVDTHCIRLSNRLGFTSSDDPARIEQDLMKLWPQEKWTLFSHCLVFHGRTICTARAPRCPQCPVNDLCPYFATQVKRPG
jgi:endonuclease-3